MTSSYPPDDDDPLDSPLSEAAITPRGGFMARPGLKSPPRHAVVVRVGDAPQSEHIPLLRSSIPPPPPAPEPEPPTASEKITLRAIPTPVSSKAAASPLGSVVPVIDSLPPPSNAPISDAPLSDAPFVTSVSEMSSGRESYPPRRSRWTIVAAAAAGLVLGLATVAARVYAPGAAAQPSRAPTLGALPGTAPAAKPAESAAAAPRTSASATPDSETPEVATPDSELSSGERKATRPATPSAKRSIF